MTVAVDDASAVAVATVPASAERGQRARRRRWWKEAGALAVAVLVLIWTLVPVYNIFMVSLESKGDEQCPLLDVTYCSSPFDSSDTMKML